MHNFISEILTLISFLFLPILTCSPVLPIMYCEPCTEVKGVTTDVCQICSVRTFLNFSAALFSLGLALSALSLRDQPSVTILFDFYLSVYDMSFKWTLIKSSYYSIQNEIFIALT